jgi:hypothetical protein
MGSMKQRLPDDCRLEHQPRVHRSRARVEPDS